MSEAHDLDIPVIDSRDVDIEEMKEKIKDLERLSLRPLVILYQTELEVLKQNLVFSTPVPGVIGKRRFELWDDEINDAVKFITELLRGANEK